MTRQSQIYKGHTLSAWVHFTVYDQKLMWVVKFPIWGSKRHVHVKKSGCKCMQCALTECVCMDAACAALAELAVTPLLGVA